MLLPKLREEVLEANLELVRRGLVLYTFGNSSGISREDSLLVIKPSGVPYETMKPEDLVVTDLHDKIIEGHLRPSSGLATHIVLYKVFRKSVASATPTPSMQLRGLRHARPSPVSAPRTPIITAAQFR